MEILGPKIEDEGYAHCDPPQCGVRVNQILDRLAPEALTRDWLADVRKGCEMERYVRQIATNCRATRE